MNTDAKFFNKIYLTKPVTDLKTRNYKKKKIVKEILKGIHNLKHNTLEDFSIVKLLTLPKIICRFNANSIKTPVMFLQKYQNPFQNAHGISSDHLPTKSQDNLGKE